eukprot:1195693-Prorocentrum_minimum.AAC.8
MGPFMWVLCAPPPATPPTVDLGIIDQMDDPSTTDVDESNNAPTTKNTLDITDSDSETDTDDFDVAPTALPPVVDRIIDYVDNPQSTMDVDTSNMLNQTKPMPIITDLDLDSDFDTDFEVDTANVVDSDTAAADI